MNLTTTAPTAPTNTVAADDAPLAPHQQRVVTESLELGDKVTKLEAFIGGAIWDSLSSTERLLLSLQLDAMRSYHMILGQRISLWK
jgi:hypothetical protein